MENSEGVGLLHLRSTFQIYKKIIIYNSWDINVITLSMRTSILLSKRGALKR